MENKELFRRVLSRAVTVLPIEERERQALAALKAAQREEVLLDPMADTEFFAMVQRCTQREAKQKV